MKKILILLYSLLLFNFQCGERYMPCSDADNCNMPVSTVYIPLMLSRSESILHVGDTLRFYARIPDTLLILEGPELNQQLLVKSSYAKRNNSLQLSMISGDSVSISPNSINPLNIFYKNSLEPRISKIYSKTQNATPWNNNLNFDLITRELEFFVVLDTTGYYIFDATIHQITLTTKDDRNWLLKGLFKFKDQKTNAVLNPNYEQCLQLINPDSRPEIRQRLRLKPNWNCWQVKP